MDNDKELQFGRTPEWHQNGIAAFNRVMTQMLNLGQTCLSENQYEAFRKMTLGFFADGKKSLLGQVKKQWEENFKAESKEIVGIRV